MQWKSENCSLGLIQTDNLCMFSDHKGGCSLLIKLLLVLKKKKCWQIFNMIPILLVNVIFVFKLLLKRVMGSMRLS